MGRPQADDAELDPGVRAGALPQFLFDTGHGHLGWTMACGSGKFLADLVAGRRTDIDPQGLLYRA